jgi:hypothetical protein
MRPRRRDRHPRQFPPVSRSASIRLTFACADLFRAGLGPPRRPSSRGLGEGTPIEVELKSRTTALAAEGLDSAVDERDEQGALGDAFRLGRFGDSLVVVSYMRASHSHVGPCTPADQEPAGRPRPEAQERPLTLAGFGGLRRRHAMADRGLLAGIPNRPLLNERSRASPAYGWGRPMPSRHAAFLTAATQDGACSSCHLGQWNARDVLTSETRPLGGDRSRDQPDSSPTHPS